MPQTISDHTLSRRLQNLIDGELQPSTFTPPMRLPQDFTYDEELEIRAQKLREQYSLEYVYPLLLAGYSYPYTKWLMLRRELARLEREKASKICSTRTPVKSNERNEFVHSKYESEPNLDKFHAYKVTNAEEYAYDYRAKPWEYMNLLKKKELMRSMEDLS